MSSPTWNDEWNGRIADIRRQAGLSQKALAEKLGISLWALDQIECGRSEAAPYLARIRSTVGLSLPQPKAVEGRRLVPAVTADSSQEISAIARRNLVLTSIALLVLVRFFSEVVPIVPRAANFIDIPLLLLLSLCALRVTAGPVRDNYMRVALPVTLFLGLCAVSVAVNPSRVELGPVLVFVYGFLGPLAVYAAVYRLWPTGHAMSLSKTLVGLGVIQLVVVLTIDLPRFAAHGYDPDLISGTFGTNAYQLVFFLLVFTGVLFGVFTFERTRLAARVAPLLFVLILASIFLAQYRALLVTSALTVALIGLLLGARARGVVGVVAVIVSFVLVLSYVSHRFPDLKFAQTVATLSSDPGLYLNQRWEAVRNVINLYSDDPTTIITGTGPGTFSSRAWQTFASIGSTSRSNVQGPYVSKLTGGVAYHTDVSDRYVLPQLQTGAVIQGSHAVTSPFSSYLSLMAEVGLFGFFLITSLYVGAAAHAVRMTRKIVRDPRAAGPLPGILLGCTVAFTVLLQMGLLENWLEVARVTFLAWTILAVASKEVGAANEAEA